MNFVTLNEAITTQAQAVATQAQAMVAQENPKVGPRVQKNHRTMTSILTDFSRMNPPMFFGSKVNKGP